MEYLKKMEVWKLENSNNKKIQQKKEHPSITKGKEVIAAHDKKEAEQQIQDLTLAQQLEKSVVSSTVEIKYKDDTREYIIKCRLFYWKEQETQLELMKRGLRLAKSKIKDKAKQKKAQDQYMIDFFKMLAYPDGVCLDSSLTVSWFKKGKYPQFLPRLIMDTVSKASMQGTEDAKSFREQKLARSSESCDSD